MESKRTVPPTKPHFFRPFLPGSERQLSIPVAFFRRFEAKWCDNVQLRDANRKLWHVKVDRGKLQLQDGWDEFVREHGLKLGNFLVFRHEGDMLFDVMVFDNSQVDGKLENNNLNEEGTQHMNAKASVKKTKVTATIQGKAKPSRLRNPCFATTMTSTSTTRSKLKIPVKFARENCLCIASCDILLENQQGKSWTAKLKYDERQRRARIYIGSGWSTFRSENNIHYGDSFVFELIKGKKHVFRMHGLRKAKKEPNPARKSLPTWDIKSVSSIRNPYLITTINLSSARKYQLFIPAQFARRNGLIGKSCSMILEDEQAKPWPMSIRSCVDRIYVGNGWWNFLEAKGLETGDRVILEFVKNRGKTLMKFHGITDVTLQSAEDAE